MRIAAVLLDYLYGNRMPGTLLSSHNAQVKCAEKSRAICKHGKLAT